MAAFVASRLTVIISQSAGGHAHHAEIEESLLAELMMTAGLDATWVGPLERVQVDSTDHLCLSSFAQSIALVSPLAVEEVAGHWKRLGLTGRVLALGAEQPSSERRVYYLPLELGVLPIIKQLKQLLVDRNVRTVGLTLPLTAKPGSALEPVASGPDSDVPASALEIPPSKSPASNESAASAGAIPIEKGRPGVSGAPLLQPDVHDMDWPHLDQLVDDLDALDL